MKLLLKAKNRYHLTKKVITNKRGHKQTVYVRSDKDKNKFWKIYDKKQMKVRKLDGNIHVSLTMKNGNRFSVTKDSFNRIFKVDSVLDGTNLKGEEKEDFLGWVGSYTKYHFRKINGALRFGRFDDSKTKSVIDIIKNGMKANLTKEKVTLTRMIAVKNPGHNLDDNETSLEYFNELNRHYDIGESSYIESGFLSTSKLGFDELALNFADKTINSDEAYANITNDDVMFLELEVEPGIGYVDINQSKDDSNIVDEHEVILENDLELIYLGTRTVNINNIDSKVNKYKVVKKKGN